MDWRNFFKLSNIIGNLVSSFLVCMLTIYVLSKEINLWMPTVIALAVGILYVIAYGIRKLVSKN